MGVRSKLTCVEKSNDWGGLPTTGKNWGAPRAHCMRRVPQARMSTRINLTAFTQQPRFSAPFPHPGLGSARLLFVVLGLALFHLPHNHRHRPVGVGSARRVRCARGTPQFFPYHCARREGGRGCAMVVVTPPPRAAVVRSHSLFMVLPLRR